MLGKLTFDVLNVEFRSLDDSRELILLDVVLPDPCGSGMLSRARWMMHVPKGTAEPYYEKHIKLLIKN